MFAHLGALSGYVGVGFGFIVGPLVVWLIKRNDYPLVDDQGKEVLNFQITMLIASVICVPLILLCGIGVVLLIARGIINLICTIMGAIKANEGVAYRYPFALRLIK